MAKKDFKTVKAPQIGGGDIKSLTEQVSDRFKSCKNFDTGELDLGFTLAEMMVVMLILTIVLVAFAPLMTKRKTVDLSSPWRYASNNSDIYYGLGSNQSAMIGQNAKGSNDLSTRLVINATDNNKSHILFKKGNVMRGSFFMGTTNFASQQRKRM